MRSFIVKKIKRSIPPKISGYLVEKWGVSGVKRYAKNTIWIFAGQTTTAISFIVNILLARYLGPESFGTLNYIIAFVGIFSFIAATGLNESLPRDFAKHPDKQSAIAGNSVLILSVSSIIAWCTTLVAVFLFEGDDSLKLLMVLYSTIFLWTPINITISSLFLANVQSKQVAITQAIVILTVSALRLTLLIFTQDLFLFVATFALEPALSAFSYYFRGRKENIWYKPLLLDKEMFGTLAHSGFLLMLSSGLTYLLLRIDQVMLKTMLDDVSVGYYAAAVRLSELWYFLPSMICVSLLPALVNSHRTDFKEYFNRLKHLYFLLFGVALLIAATTAVLSPWLVAILYGQAYAPAVPILEVYAWSAIGFFLFVGINKQLLTEHRHLTILSYSLSAVIINIGLNLWLIPKLGVSGAAWSTLISYAVIPLAHFLFSRLSRNKLLTNGHTV